jgi:NADPH-dependent glutamate synthase beta subunit-like oxidoreductase
LGKRRWYRCWSNAAVFSHPKYYAGGDCANGGREVVDAVADGKRAGAAIACEVANA